MDENTQVIAQLSKIDAWNKNIQKKEHVYCNRGRGFFFELW